jgi:hypothetical protein
MSTIDSENNSKPAPEANQSKGGTGRAKEDQAREKSLYSDSKRMFSWINWMRSIWSVSRRCMTH